MASPRAGFHIDIKAPKMRIVDEKGHFVSEAQKQLYQQNRQLAIDLQGEIGRRIQNSIQRKAVSTGRLVRVTMDPKNRTSDRYFMSVGNEAFLDRSMAKYWRTIEEGSAATWTKRKFTTLPLQGFWGTNLGGWRTGPSGPWVTVNPPYSKGTGQMYHPFRIGRGGQPSPLPIFTPGHEIAPMNAYKAVAENPDLTARNLRIAANFWNAILARGIQPQASGWYPGMSSGWHSGSFE